jgi:SAM-dependent MidA family methyltransferase
MAQAGGWLPFDAFMHLALYQAGSGYYATPRPLIGQGPQDGSDFITAPQLSPLFARSLARAVAAWMAHSGVDEIWEFGAGRGALAAELLAELDRMGCGPASGRVKRYVIVEVSGALRDVQSARLAAFANVVHWAQAWPEQLHAVVLGNEVLDAMPVKLLHRVAGAWHERGVIKVGDHFQWQDRETEWRPPCAIAGAHDYLTEIAPQAQAWMHTLGAVLRRGVACLIDYGFPEHEYYHPQRAQGTLMCHRAHLTDADPLSDVGDKDITAHVDFTAMAVAAQDAGLGVVGYTSQGRFLLELGLVDLLPSVDAAAQAAALKLIHEHEMGELFKVLVVAPEDQAAQLPELGFARGDRTHTL